MFAGGAGGRLDFGEIAPKSVHPKTRTTREPERHAMPTAPCRFGNTRRPSPSRCSVRVVAREGVAVGFRAYRGRNSHCEKARTHITFFPKVGMHQHTLLRSTAHGRRRPTRCSPRVQRRARPLWRSCVLPRAFARLHGAPRVVSVVPHQRRSVRVPKSTTMTWRAPSPRGHPRRRLSPLFPRVLPR